MMDASRTGGRAVAITKRMARYNRAGVVLLLGLTLAYASACVVIRPIVDTRPPSFAGLSSAITCIPGPIGAGRTTSYQLAWTPAVDNFTPSGKIIYYVYQAKAPAMEDFASPTYVTPAGASSFSTPPLPTDQDFYFVVRAVDQAGNIDSNKVERHGENLCE
jgi:hypothetical protein